MASVIADDGKYYCVQTSKRVCFCLHLFTLREWATVVVYCWIYVIPFDLVYCAMWAFYCGPKLSSACLSPISRIVNEILPVRHFISNPSVLSAWNSSKLKTKSISSNYSIGSHDFIYNICKFYESGLMVLRFLPEIIFEFFICLLFLLTFQWRIFLLNLTCVKLGQVIG
jgi:hypothetical protein